MAARIGGDYEDYCNLLKADHLNNGRKLSGTVLVIDLYDGALHSNGRNERSSIISYSLQILISDTIRCKGGSAANSLNILTWQQVLADEKPEIVFLSIKDIFKKKRK